VVHFVVWLRSGVVYVLHSECHFVMYLFTVSYGVVLRYVLHVSLVFGVHCVFCCSGCLSGTLGS